MKQLLIVVIVCISLNVYSQEDYLLHFNDTTISIQIDKDYKFLLAGLEYNFSLHKKDSLTCKGKNFQFQYPSQHTISKTTIEDGIDQYIAMLATGSGILVQEYATINPSNMKEFMLQEVTKESINYGFIPKREVLLRSTTTGETYEVLRDVLTYKNETNIYEVATISRKDEGIMIVSLTMGNGESEEQQKLFDMVWRSIKLL